MQPLNRAFQCNGGPAVGEGAGIWINQSIKVQMPGGWPGGGGDRLSKSAFGMEVLTSCI